MTFQPQFYFLDYAAMIIYIICIVGVGFYFTKKEKNTNDYLLGGKSLPAWALGISMYVTLFSALSFVMVPEEAYLNGLRLWLQTPFVLIFAPLAFWSFLAFYYSLGSFTPYEYIESRFSPFARILSSVIFVIQKGIYLALVLFASAVAFEGAVGWNPTFTIILVGVLGTLYTIVGGFKAVVWTDVMQFFVLAGGIILVVIVVSMKVDGGFFGVISYAFENERGFNFDKEFFMPDINQRVTVWWLLLGGFGATMNYYATDQLVIQRLLASKTYKDAKKSVWVNIPISFVVGSLFWFTGIALFAYFNQAGVGEIEQYDLNAGSVLTYFISTKLPSPIPGLVMAGLLAAIMSTIDSAINSLSTVAVKDFYLRFINSKSDEHRQLFWSKWLTFVWGAYMILAALAINWVFRQTTTTLYETAALWQSLGGIVLGIFILAVSTRYLGNTGMFIAVAVAMLVHLPALVVLYYFKPADERITFVIIGNIGLGVTLVVGYLVAIINKIRGVSAPKKKVDGLTLWTIDRSKIK